MWIFMRGFEKRFVDDDSIEAPYTLAPIYKVHYQKIVHRYSSLIRKKQKFWTKDIGENLTLQSFLSQK